MFNLNFAPFALKLGLGKVKLLFILFCMNMDETLAPECFV